MHVVPEITETIDPEVVVQPTDFPVEDQADDK